MFEAHGLVSAHGAAWNLQRLQAIRTPGLQAVLKATTTFGPIVVSPDYDDTPFDYSPDLRGLIPETATESGDAVEFEELWAVVIAFAQAIAQHHHTEILLSTIGNGHRFLIRASTSPTGATVIGGGVGTALGIEIGATPGR
jgi:hypothetical protein